MSTALRPTCVEFLPDRFVWIDGAVLPLPDRALEARVSAAARRGANRGALALAVSVESGRVRHTFESHALVPISTDLPSLPDGCSLEQLAAAIALHPDELPTQILPEYGRANAMQPAYFEARTWYHPRLHGLPEVDIFVWDYRGTGAFLFDDEPAPWAPMRRLGDDLTASMLSTTISGERGRRDQALLRLAAGAERDERPAAWIAGAASEYFMSEAVEHDGGIPVLGFYIIIETAAGTEIVLPDRLRAGSTDDHRLARLGGAVRGALNGDAFGTGIDSARSKRAKVSLDEGHEADDACPADAFDEILAGQLDAVAFLTRLEDRLDDDERALLRAKRLNPDHSLAAIAADRGWEVAAVRAVWRRITRKARTLN